MEKELNPNLFAAGAETARDLGNGWYYDPNSNFRSAERPLDRADLRRVEEQFQNLTDKVQETVKTTTLKTEKLGQRMAQMEQRSDALSHELRTKYASLSGKITERNLQESEIHGLLERHNQIIRNFENRMTQLQRLIEQQQLQMMNSQAALEEARREIARMKRI